MRKKKRNMTKSILKIIPGKRSLRQRNSRRRPNNSLMR
jgi:hypothetical protein